MLDNHRKILHHVDIGSGQIVGGTQLVGEDNSGGWTDPCVHRVSGELFVAMVDTLCNMVHIFDMQSGKKVRSIGTGSYHTQFCCVHSPPDAPAIVLVNNRGRHYIDAFDWASGAHLWTTGKGHGGEPGQMRCPGGIVLWTPRDDPAAGAQLIVADFWNHRLQFFRLADGEYLRSIGGEEDGEEGPCALVLHRPAGGRDEDALIMVATCCAFVRVHVYRLVSGEYLRSICDDSRGAFGDAVAVYQPPGQPDSETQLVVSDDENEKLHVYRLHSGAHLYSICRSRTFCSPEGVCSMPEAQDDWDYVLK